MTCRNCGHSLDLDLIDLGAPPPSNAYLDAADLTKPEPGFPLRVKVCESCFLVQTADEIDPKHLFTGDYGYFSSVSASWVAHAKRFVDTAIERLALDSGSLVVEVAANDGYLLQHVVSAGIPCYGIEPTAGTAAAARSKGIDIVEDFLGASTGAALKSARGGADLVIANNVLAHVPAINGFTAGLAALMKPVSTLSLEFPHLLSLLAETQFDTIYHEHYSYLSLGTVTAILRAHGVEVFDVETLSTHGGSLRVWAQPAGTGRHPISPSVARMIRKETGAGLFSRAAYAGFQKRAETIRDQLTRFLKTCRREGKRVGGYGAAAKGNTLLNFAGVGPELLPYVADRSPGKIGRYLPGSHIPIVSEARLREDRPDHVILLPWNLKDELTQQLSYIGEWGGSFVVAVPALDMIDAAPDKQRQRTLPG